MMNKLVLLPFLAILISCGTPKGTTVTEVKKDSYQPTISFESTSLKLISLSEGDDSWSNEEYEITLMLNLEESSFNGKSGCNNFFGSIEKTGENTLKVGMAGVTEMMCVEDIMKWEARYLNVLVDHEFSVFESDDMVQLRDTEHGSVLTFSK